MRDSDGGDRCWYRCIDRRMFTDHPSATLGIDNERDGLIVPTVGTTGRKTGQMEHVGLSAGDRRSSCRIVREIEIEIEIGFGFGARGGKVRVEREDKQAVFDHPQTGVVRRMAQ